MARIKKERLVELTGRVDNNSDQIKDISDMLLKPYIDSINDFMVEFLVRVRDKENPPTADELRVFVARIPVEAYFVCEGLSALGVKEDVAKAIKNELYNQAHLDADARTVDERKSLAELEVIEETIIQSAYTRANQLLKQKIEFITETLNSCKILLKYEMNKMEIAKRDKY